MGVVEPAAPKDGCGVVQKRGGKDPKTSKTAAESRAETRANGRKNSSLPGLDARRGAEAAHKCPEGAETRTKVPKSAAKSRAETRAKGRKSCSLPGSNGMRGGTWGAPISANKGAHRDADKNPPKTTAKAAQARR